MIENKVLLQSVQYHKTAAGDRLNWDVMRRVHDHSLLLHHPCELTKNYYWTIHVGKVDQKNQEINKITIYVGKVDQKIKKSKKLTKLPSMWGKLTKQIK